MSSLYHVCIPGFKSVYSVCIPKQKKVCISCYHGHILFVGLPQCLSPNQYQERLLNSVEQGNLKIALRGGGGVTWTPAEGGGGGVGEMGFRVGPFVLCKNGCWRQRHRNTKFGPKKFFPPIIPPPTFE